MDQGRRPQPTGKEPLTPVVGRDGVTRWGRPRPTECAAGHPLVPGTLSISWVGCQCPDAMSGGHELWFCHTVVEGRECNQPRWQPQCQDPSRRNDSNQR